MAQKLLLFFLLLHAVLLAEGQDLITRSDGVVLRATVLETKPGLLRFKLYQQPDTAVYQISTRDVASLRLANGTVKTFPEAAEKEAEPFNYETSSGRHILWFYPLDLVYANLTLAYERILASGKVGVRFPLRIGLSGNSPENYYAGFGENTRFGSGLEMNIYPSGQGRFKYYLGPAFHYRSYRAYYYSTYSGSPPVPQMRHAGLFTMALKTGVYFQASKFFTISLDAGLGLRFFREPELPDNYYNYDPRNRAYFPANLHLGYRF